MALFVCLFIAHHIMRRVVQFINLLICCTHTVIGNNDRTNSIFSYNTNEDMASLFIMIHAVLNQITYCSFN